MVVRFPVVHMKKTLILLLSALLTAVAVIMTVSSLSGDAPVFADGSRKNTITGLVGELIRE